MSGDKISQQLIAHQEVIDAFCKILANTTNEDHQLGLDSVKKLTLSGLIDANILDLDETILLIDFMRQQEALIQYESRSGFDVDKIKDKYDQLNDEYSRLAFLICLFLKDLLYVDDQFIDPADCQLMDIYLQKIVVAIDQASRNTSDTALVELFTTIGRDQFKPLQQEIAKRLQEMQPKATAGLQPQQTPTAIIIAGIIREFNSEDLAEDRIQRIQKLVDPIRDDPSSVSVSIRNLEYLTFYALQPEALQTILVPPPEVTNQQERSFLTQQKLLENFAYYLQARTDFGDSNYKITIIVNTFLKALMEQAAALGQEIKPKTTTAKTIFRTNTVPKLFSTVSYLPTNYGALEVLANEFMFYRAAQLMAEKFFAVPPEIMQSKYNGPAPADADPVTLSMFNAAKSGRMRRESYRTPPIRDRYMLGDSDRVQKIESKDIIKMIKIMLRLKNEPSMYIANPMVLGMLLSLYEQYAKIQPNIAKIKQIRQEIEGLLQKILIRECDKYSISSDQEEHQEGRQHSLATLLAAYKFLIKVDEENIPLAEVTTQREKEREKHGEQLSFLDLYLKAFTSIPYSRDKAGEILPIGSMGRDGKFIFDTTYNDGYGSIINPFLSELYNELAERLKNTSRSSPGPRGI